FLGKTGHDLPKSIVGKPTWKRFRRFVRNNESRQRDEKYNRRHDAKNGSLGDHAETVLSIGMHCKLLLLLKIGGWKLLNCYIQKITAHDAYDLIRSIRNNEESLGTIGGKRDVPYGSTSKRLLRNERFFDERSILLENLNPIVRPIAYINEPIIRDSRGMHDTELWWRRASRLILAWAVFMLDSTIEGTRKALSCILEVRIIGLPSVRAPMASISPGVSIEHDDSMIHVSIGDVEFVSHFIDDQRRDRKSVV